MEDRTNEIFDLLFAIFDFGFPRWNPHVGHVPDAQSEIENKKSKIKNRKSHSFYPLSST